MVVRTITTVSRPRETRRPQRSDAEPDEGGDDDGDDRGDRAQRQRSGVGQVRDVFQVGRDVGDVQEVAHRPDRGDPEGDQDGARLASQDGHQRRSPRGRGPGRRRRVVSALDRVGLHHHPAQRDHHQGQEAPDDEEDPPPPRLHGVRGQVAREHCGDPDGEQGSDLAVRGGPRGSEPAPMRAGRLHQEHHDAGVLGADGEARQQRKSTIPTPPQMPTAV